MGQNHLNVTLSIMSCLNEQYMYKLNCFIDRLFYRQTVVSNVVEEAYLTLIYNEALILFYFDCEIMLISVSEINQN